MTEVDGHASDLSSQRRKQSLMPRDGDNTSGPNIRRMSRLDARPSMQYGLSGRRMSHISRSSISGASIGQNFKAPVAMANTYRMAPACGEKFQAKRAEDLMSSVLESYLGGEKYMSDNCNNFVQQISDVIKSRMKDMGFSPRYKFVCMVTIGQNRNQGVAVVSRSIWNPETDDFATASFSSGDIFANASIFATYFE